MPIDLNMEPEGLDLLLVGLGHPNFLDNRLCRALHNALSLEWTCRQTGETNEDNGALPGLGTLTLDELKTASGFFYGLSCSVDVTHYRRTFWFCFNLLESLSKEIEFRSSGSETMH
jgi:hypothetical protein